MIIYYYDSERTLADFTLFALLARVASVALHS